MLVAVEGASNSSAGCVGGFATAAVDPASGDGDNSANAKLTPRILSGISEPPPIDILIP